MKIDTLFKIFLNKGFCKAPEKALEFLTLFSGKTVE